MTTHSPALPTALDKPARITIRGATKTRGRVTIPRSVRRAAGPVGLVLLWFLTSATGVLPESVLASPVDVLKQAVELTRNGELPSAIAASGRRAATGFLIGATIALSLSLLAGLFRLGEDVIDSSMGMFRAIPWVGLIPLFIVWFGIEETPKIALVALGVTYPLYFNIYGGIRSTDSQLVEAARMMGLGRLGLITYVILPSALPGALVGLRYALSTAWLALVFAEQINADAGLGYLMSNAQQYFRTDVIVLCLVVYALLGLACDFAVRILSRRLLTWRANFEGEA
ncbi:sulfonate transport system permease protein [Streptomyces sp. SAI-144]|uniref:ABC transporter permease n=1 Tax=unclassified Streptomyces TaxID=2593676 RepID=UPI002475BAE1|nr:MULTISPECIES: ABC transporter permease [unclassified Streptomyces]MDH6432080.1 sulfonate transport system permease protein [Streptomyces sp. SAI-144]MDH6492562.1 sulfonate transport system permease protein [Streptomyces sp. SAI-127]